MTRGGEPRMARLQAGADLSRPSGRSFGLDLDFGILLIIAFAVGVRLIALGVAVAVAGDLERVVFGWDGGWYRSIALDGYPPMPTDLGAEQSAWAFFPLWPAVLAGVIRIPMVAPEVAVVVFGLLLTVLDVLLLVLLLGRILDWADTRLVALLWAAAPPAWVYLAAYSEPLFVTLQLALLVAVIDRRRIRVATFGLLIGLVRFQGILWALFAAVAILRGDTRDRRRWVYALVAVAGAVGWQIAVSVLAGRPLAWFAIETAPGWPSGFGLKPWILAFETLAGLPAGRFDLRGLPLIVLLGGTVAAMVVLLRRRSFPGRTPTLLNAAIPLFIESTLSIPRYLGQLPLLFVGLRPLARTRTTTGLLVTAMTLASVAMSVTAFLPGFGNQP